MKSRWMVVEAKHKVHCKRPRKEGLCKQQMLGAAHSGNGSALVKRADAETEADRAGHVICFISQLAVEVVKRSSLANGLVDAEAVKDLLQKR